ncbi:MAG: hypothetical protein AABZ53_11945 [Planctomycetota bacterium]
MFAWLRRKKDTKPLPTSVTIEGERVRVFAEGVEIESFVWDQVELVAAWKQDCWGMDRIWVGFDCTDAEELVCVHEEMEGYQALIDQMQSRCTGHLADWWSKVAFPAFVKNLTVVWRRAKSET